MAHAPADAVGASPAHGPVEQLLVAADAVADREVDGLTDAAIVVDLEALEGVRRRLEAHQCRLADEHRARRASALVAVTGPTGNAGP